MCKAVLAAGGHFLFVCKPSSHLLIKEYTRGVKLPTHAIEVRHGRKRATHRFRWMNQVPLCDGNVTYRNSFITDLPVSRETVAERITCGRSRGKIENETFNVLKTGGYHLEHSFGHGRHNLAALLVTLNLLAFAFYTVCDHGETLWQLVRSKPDPGRSSSADWRRSPVS